MIIPRELQRSAPREISLTALGWKSMLSRCVYPALVISAGVLAANSTWVHASATAHNTPLWLAWGWRAGLSLLLAAAVGFARFRQQSHLLRYGRATVARVKGEKTPLWYNLRKSGGRRTRWRRMQCEFRLLNGRVCPITVDTQGKVPDKDAEVIVVYDPDQPEKAMLYPARMLRIDGH
jgi:hypothetical protein